MQTSPTITLRGSNPNHVERAKEIILRIDGVTEDVLSVQHESPRYNRDYGDGLQVEIELDVPAGEISRFKNQITGRQEITEQNLVLKGSEKERLTTRDGAVNNDLNI